jgi:hypothetical protein
VRHPVQAVLSTAVVALCCLGTACRADPTARPPDDVSTELVSSERLGDPFIARQRVTASYGGRQTSFDAVLQHDGKELILLALTPMGTKAFVLRQRGADLEYRSFIERALPFPPGYVMLDIHRTFFIGLPRPPYPDGEHGLRRGDQRISEVWRGGRLLQRRFAPSRRRDGAGQVSIDYGEGMKGKHPPPVVQLENGRFGYRLTIRTLSYQELPPP